MTEFQLEQERYELHAGPGYRFHLERRDFIKLFGGGIFVLLAVQPQASGQRSRRDRVLGAWLQVGENGDITIFTGKAEVGQNIRTSLTQVAAEELQIRPTRITMVMGDTLLTPFDIGTFGSRTTPITSPQMRRVAATAREMLFGIAAEKWQVSRANLVMERGRVKNLDTGATARLRELAKGQTMIRTISADAQVIAAWDWKVAGHDLRKVNGRSIVTGEEKYTSDLKLPQMMYGRVVRPNAFQASLVSCDLEPARSLPGVIAVNDGNFVGVVCENPEDLDRAAEAVKVEWKAPEQPGSRGLYSWLRTHSKKTEEWRARDGDVNLEASYDLPYIAHVPLEPRCAVAEWKDGGLTVHTGTQVPFGVRRELCESFGLNEDQVRVIVPPTGSGYGGKHSGECALEAARLAKAAGRPVKLQWTREEEFTWAYFRPAGVIEIRSAVRRDGTISAWQMHNINSGGAGIRSPYQIPNQLAEAYASDSPLRQGSYRGLAATANHFARESHMDELAHALEMDPLAFRLKNASDPRLRAVIKAATDKFGWKQWKRTPRKGRGMMAGFDKGGYVAACAEVTIVNNQIRVDRIVEAFECGAIINPDQLRNQVVGGMIMGLGGALFESITFDNGRILNPRLSRYRVPRFRDIPEIEAVLLDRKDLPSAGAGETPIVGVAPAIANAIFDATGKRLRSMPLKLT